MTDILPGRVPDVRMRGFIDRAPIEEAWAWLDAFPDGACSETLSLSSAIGRVLAEDIVTSAGAPGMAVAATDGYAVRAADCDGAGAYNPLRLTLHEARMAMLPPEGTCPVAAGWVMPSGADAVLPFEAVDDAVMGGVDVLAPVASGSGIDRHGHGLPDGFSLLRRGQTLSPRQAACLQAIGLTTLPVRTRPRVRVLIPGAKSGPDILAPMLADRLAQDGAMTEIVPLGGADDFAAALARYGGGIVLIAGRSGAGPDDGAAAAIHAAGGSLALHGLAINPGDSAGLGRLGEAPVILLPGDPYACLVTYDMLAARLVRRFAGMEGAWPYACVSLPLERKIVSAIGLTDIVPLRIAGGLAHPVGVAGLGGLLADGFVVVSATSEGRPAGSIVQVHLYDPAHGRVEPLRP